MNSIHIVTQPEPEVNVNENEVLDKLKELVGNNPPEENSDKMDDKCHRSEPSQSCNHSESSNKFEERTNVPKRDDTNKPKENTEDLKKIDEKGDESESDTNYDEDGFEVPKGKIPLDGNFSTSEIKQLVDIAKNQQMLDKHVEVQVLQSNEIGDKIIIADQGDQEKEEELIKEEEEQKKKDDEQKAKEKKKFGTEI